MIYLFEHYRQCIAISYCQLMSSTINYLLYHRPSSTTYRPTSTIRPAHPYLSSVENTTFSKKTQIRVDGSSDEHEMIKAKRSFWFDCDCSSHALSSTFVNSNGPFAARGHLMVQNQHTGKQKNLNKENHNFSCYFSCVLFLNRQILLCSNMAYLVPRDHQLQNVY